MLTGQVVRILANPHRVTRYFSGTTWSPGRRRGRTRCPDPVLKLSIALWQTVLPKPPGCASFSLSFMPLLGALRWSTATNISAVYMSSNPVQHQHTKHIEIDLHFVRERVAVGDVRVMHVPTSSQDADIFTKGLPSSVFTEFRSSLNVRAADDQTAGAC